jgi:uncharacterized membrane protein HdeD (DUF308 family)
MIKTVHGVKQKNLQKRVNMIVLGIVLLILGLLLALHFLFVIGVALLVVGLILAVLGSFGGMTYYGGRRNFW